MQKTDMAEHQTIPRQVNQMITTLLASKETVNVIQVTKPLKRGIFNSQWSTL